MELSTDRLLRMAFDATADDPGDLPDGMEERVMARCRGGAKPSQHPDWAGPVAGAMGSLGAFVKTAAELVDLLDSLAPRDWGRPTRVEGATVRDLVEHLVGVERYLLGQLGRRPHRHAPGREDHWPVTMSEASDLAGEPDTFVARAWWFEVLAVVAACGESAPDRQVVFHHLAGSLRGLLLVRTFELWTHGDDVRHAVGRPLDLLDETRLSLMAGELMRVLPLGLALSGCPQPGRTARIDLTGPGGGSFHVALAPGELPGDPDISLTVDVVDLCRWASNRLAHDDLDVLVEGDRALLEPILVGATAFASD